MGCGRVELPSRRNTCRRRKPTARLATYILAPALLLRVQSFLSDVKRVIMSQEKWSFVCTLPGTCCTRARPPARSCTAMYLRADHGVCCCYHASGGVSTYEHASHNRQFDEIRRADHRPTHRRPALSNNITQVLRI